MSVYQQYLVTIRTKSDTIQVTISAMDSGSAARAAQSMYPGSTVTRIEQINPR
ncbi:MAG: hypothetical protein U0640_07805 [Phycisphaerales bacterium]